jgi:DNA-binding NarL/FixJ family response regulator
LPKSTVRILLVDDFESWRRFVASTLHQRPEFEILAEVSDGLVAVEKAEELLPDLILMDVGLPMLNGIEAARRILDRVSRSRILFLSENRSADIAREALSTGAGGYVLKADAARELLPAIEAVLQGKRFVSASLVGCDGCEPSNGKRPPLVQRSSLKH